MMPQAVLSLRQFWKLAGILYNIIAFAAILVMVIDIMVVFNNRLRGLQYLFLMFLVEVNSLVGLIVYLNLMSSQIYQLYSQIVDNAIIANLVFCFLSLCLELYIIGKYNMLLM